MNGRASIAAGFAVLALVGCAPVPPPDVLREVARLRKAPSVVDASSVAPAARARADALVVEADRALAEGDPAAAQFLGEEARAAYVALLADARLVRAVDRRVRSEAETAAAAEELAAVRVADQRVVAQADALAERLDALDRAASASTEVALEARRRSAELSRFEARVACAAAELAIEESASVVAPDASRAALVKLRAELDAEPPAAAPRSLDRVADDCRDLLTALRTRPRAEAPRQDGPTLTGELVLRGFDPRETREGTLVRLAAVSGKRAPDDRARVAVLAGLAAKHGRSLVVLARSARLDEAALAVAQRAGHVFDSLLDSGRPATRVRGPIVGRGLPARLDPDGPYAASDDAVELLFVTTQAM